MHDRIRIRRGLLASAAAAIGWRVAARAADDAYIEDGQGLHRQGRRAGDGMGRPDDRPEGAGQEARSSIVSTDQRNGGAQGAGDGAAEAAKVLGWDFRILDGQGSVPGRTSALTQAIALKPDGIILGTASTPRSRRR